MIYILGFYPNNGRSIKISNAIMKYNDIEIKFVYWNMTGLKILAEDKNNFIFSQDIKHTKFNKLKSMVKFYKFIKLKIKEYDPDVVLAYHWDIFILTKLANYGRKKMIYDVSDIPGYKGITYLFIKKIEEFFISKDDILLFASRFFKEKYSKIDKNKTLIIDNKPEKFFLKNKVKRNLSFKNDNVNIAFIGVYRDLDVLKNIIDAAENENMNLLFFGEGAIEEELKNYSRGKKNVYILGRYNYNEIPLLYNVSDAILSLYSNKDENTNLATGNKFFKVQAFKKVGIFPKGTKMGDYMEEKKIGLVVDPYSTEEIKAAFLEIIVDSDRVKRIKKNLLNIPSKDIFWEYEEEKLKKILS